MMKKTVFALMLVIALVASVPTAAFASGVGFTSMDGLITHGLPADEKYGESKDKGKHDEAIAAEEAAKKAQQDPYFMMQQMQDMIRQLIQILNSHNHVMNDLMRRMV
ncbi:hypothetical protein MO973_12925 [Paenibacillus sp. TRM 82003]|nr:hypothetical protein [Paenibacillus sp. TRM 82003]